MKKKVLAGILAATMAFSMAACGSTGSSSDSGSSAASGSTAKTEEKGEPYTVTMVLQGSQQQDEERIEEKINEILEPELNAKLDIVVLPWASASQQLQLMLSGDEKIDLLYTNATTAVQYMHSGQIMDMSELIDKYGTNLKDIYGEDIAKTNQIDGFVYGVPNQIERGSIPAIFMRKDLVEKYNINTDEIKEPKDMEKVFETVQAGEPDMTMLFSSNNSDTPLSRLSRADGLGDANTGALMDQTNSTTVENYFASDWYKETATMLHDWYQKGYISKDAGTNTENWRTVCKAGNLFSLFFAYHPGTPVEFQSSTGYEFEIVPFYDQPIINSSSYGGIIFSVAQNSENPEKAMQVLDYIYGSPEVMNLLNWGEEGTDYVVEDEENGIINYPDGVTADNAGYSFNCGWELPNQFIAYKWDGSDPQLWDKMQEFNASGIESKALGFVFDNSEYADQVSALNNVISQYNGALSSGSGDPEELLPQFLEALDDAGINDVIAAKQEQLDAWLAENKTEDIENKETLSGEEEERLAELIQRLEGLEHIRDTETDCMDLKCPYHYPEMIQQRMAEDELPELLTLEDLVEDYGMEPPEENVMPVTVWGTGLPLRAPARAPALTPHPQTLMVTNDNENNSHTGKADGDIDESMGCSNKKHPIELAFTLDELPTQSAYLAVKAYDVDEDDGETDYVYLNDDIYLPMDQTNQSGKQYNKETIGYLSGTDNTWNTTVLEIPLEKLKKGKNVISVTVAPRSWIVRIDWMQLVLDGGTADPNIEKFSLELQDTSTKGKTVTVQSLVTIRQKGNKEYATEYTLTQTETGNALDACFGKAKSQEQIALSMPLDSPSGVYKITGILKDPKTEEIKATDSFSFYFNQDAGLGPKVSHTLSPDTLTNRDVTITVKAEDMLKLGITDVKVTDGVTKTATVNKKYTFTITYKLKGSDKSFLYPVWVDNIDKTAPVLTYTPVTVVEEEQ